MIFCYFFELNPSEDDLMLLFELNKGLKLFDD